MDGKSILFVLVFAHAGAQVDAQGPCLDEVLLNELPSGAPGPALRTPDGAPVIGGPFSVQIEGALPNMAGALVWSNVEAPFFDPGYGATFHFGVPFNTIFFTTDADGDSPPLVVVSKVPAVFCGAFLVMQAGVFDTSAPNGVAVTDAIRLRVGVVTEPLFGFESLANDGTESPGSMAFGDMNEDGVRDLVTVNSGFIAWVRPGLVGGGFGPALKTTLTSISSSIADLADIDGDGHLDLVRLGGVVAFGDGAGSFTAESVSRIGSSTVAVADLDGNGSLDLASSSFSSTTVTVRLGTGVGTFGLPVFYSGGSGPDPLVTYNIQGSAVVAGDLDTDGDQDLVAALAFHEGGQPPFFPGTYFYRSSVLEGAGDGTFGNPVIYDDAMTIMSLFVDPVASPISLVLDDFDSDTELDLAAAYAEVDRVCVRLGNGDLTWGPVLGHSVGEGPQELATADVDGDTILDLAVRNADTADISVLVGNGDGTFTSTGRFGVFPDAKAIAIDDVDLDGTRDLLVSGVSEILFLPGNGDGTFPGALRFATALDPLAIEDFDEDGENDLIVRLRNPNRLALRLHNEDGSFDPPTVFATVNAISGQLEVADANGDGFADLFLGHFDFWVILGHGDGTFDPPATLAIDIRDYALADFDGDLKLDVVTTRDSFPGPDGLEVLLGNGDGTFGSPLAFATPDRARNVVAGDVDGDTFIDIVYFVGDFFSVGDIELMAGNGDGTFDPPTTLISGTFIHSMCLSDMDDDDDLDLLLARDFSASDIDYYQNGGTGAFSLAQTVTQVFPSNDEVARLYLEDMDGDGDTDVIARSQDDVHDYVVVFPWVDPGQLGTPFQVQLGLVPEGLAVGDLDCDGIPDLAVVDQSAQGDGTLSILRNQLGE